MIIRLHRKGRFFTDLALSEVKDEHVNCRAKNYRLSTESATF